MKLEVTNTVVRVVAGDDVEKGWLREYLSFDDESRAFRKDRRSGRVERVKPPKIRLYNVLDETFPTGLLALVRKRAAVLGHAVELRDVRPAGVPVDPAAELRWLRPYQADALEAAVRRGRGILWLPTGAGKTEVAVGLTRALPTRWLFIVHRAGLMYQAAERYDLRNAEHGIALPPAARFGDGKLELGDRLTVATFQTVRAKLESTVGRELLRRTEGVIVDECHTLPAETFYGVAMSFLGARYRLGLSGTPLDRDDKRSLMAVGALGPVIHRVRTEELVDAGVLAIPRVRMITVEQDIYRPTYQGVYGEAIVRSTKRNRLLADVVARAAARPAVVFVREIAHGKNLLRYLERAGLRVELVWGTTPEATRARTKKDLSRGNLDAVVASVVWQEGIDVPELRSVVVAAAGRSTIAALQRAGRGMRRTDEKTSFEIWDVEDRGNAILERHSKARRKAYEREGFEVVDVDLAQLPLEGAAEAPP